LNVMRTGATSAASAVGVRRHNENDVTMTTAGLWRYGNWRHVATGCTLVYSKNNHSAFLSRKKHSRPYTSTRKQKLKNVITRSYKNRPVEYYEDRCAYLRANISRTGVFTLTMTSSAAATCAVKRLSA